MMKYQTYINLWYQATNNGQYNMSFLGIHGRYKTFIDADIIHLSDEKGSFVKAMLSNMSAGNSALNSISFMATFKGLMSSRKALKRMGFLADSTGVERVTISAISSFISNSTHETEIDIKENIYGETIYIYRLSSTKKIEKDIYLGESIDHNGFTARYLNSEPSLRDNSFVSFNNNEYAAYRYLEDNFESKSDENHNQSIEYNVFDTSYQIDYKTYKSGAEWYKPVIIHEHGLYRLDCDSDDGNIKIKLENINDGSIIYSTLSNRILYTVALYRSRQNPTYRLIVMKDSDVAGNENNLSFMMSTIKDNGVNKIDKRSSLFHRMMGIPRFSDSLIENDEVKDVALVLSSNMNHKVIGKYLKRVYGSSKHQQKFVVDKNSLSISYDQETYNISDEYTNETHSETRNMVNIYSGPDVVLPSGTTTDSGKNSTGNSGYTVSNNAHTVTLTDDQLDMYLVPAEVIKKMTIKEFYDCLPDMLNLFYFAEQTQYVKWYSTGLFQGLMIIAAVVMLAFPPTSAYGVAILTGTVTNSFAQVLGLNEEQTIALTIVVAILTYRYDLVVKETALKTGVATTATTAPSAVSSVSIKTAEHTTVQNIVFYGGVVIQAVTAIDNHLAKKDIENYNTATDYYNSEMEKMARESKSLYNRPYNFFNGIQDSFDYAYKLPYRQMEADNSVYDIASLIRPV